MTSENTSSFTDKVVKGLSHKGDQHEYVTNLLAKHQELFKTPHLQQMYSDSYKRIKLESKTFCSDIAMLKWNKINKTQPNSYQELANIQAEAQECVADSLNLYFDVVSSVGQRYNQCKSKCLETNTALAKELED